MFHRWNLIITVILIPVMFLPGCYLRSQSDVNYSAGELDIPLTPSALDELSITEPTLDPGDDPVAADFGEPLDSLDMANEGIYHDLSLQECIEYALEHSKVMRNLGGTVLTFPDTVNTVFDPARQYTDPQFGEEAALSAFDTVWSGQAIYEKNDRAFNNNLIGTNGFLIQDLADIQTQLQKRSATGSIFTFRQTAAFDRNNSVGNRFSDPNRAVNPINSSDEWNLFLDMEVRQPLLRGAGLEFNRIAGPSTQPGVINGVLVSRVRTDISLAEFETGIRNLISDVENAYWDLYFSYLDFDAKVRARDRALEILFLQEAEEKAGAETGAASAQAREQFYRFQADALDAVNGRVVDGTRVGNGSTGGTFRNSGGVRIAERRLRLMVGLPINDGQLLRPSDKPIEMPVKFDWGQSVQETMAMRPEIRRQRWIVKQRELELLANKNFLLPSLDLLARYRFRGVGNKLAGGDNPFPSPAEVRTNSGAAGSLGQLTQTNALADLIGADRQEWQLGLEFSVPIGFRREHAAVRQAELSLAREVAVLGEQKRTTLFTLSNSIADVKRAYQLKTVLLNRYNAVANQVRILNVQLKTGRTQMNVVLEAERRMVETEIAYAQAAVEYMLAVRNVHVEKGTYLDNCGILLAESSSPSKAYSDAQNRERLKSEPMDYTSDRMTISSGRSPSAAGGVIETVTEVSAPGAPVEMMQNPQMMQPQMMQPQMTNPVSPAVPTAPQINPAVGPQFQPMPESGTGIWKSMEGTKVAETKFSPGTFANPAGFFPNVDSTGNFSTVDVNQPATVAPVPVPEPVAATPAEEVTSASIKIADASAATPVLARPERAGLIPLIPIKRESDNETTSASTPKNSADWNRLSDGQK